MVKNLRIQQKVINGFTLVELLVVMAILAIMGAILVATINPIAMVNKAKDSRRKNDLNKIKIAFEEYYNDKGVYPSADSISSWNRIENCDNIVTDIQKYLKKWPCDPNKNTYTITIINDKTTYKVVTNLENKKDKDIPPQWYEDNTYPAYEGQKSQVNYGVSSSNILWYGQIGVDEACGNGLDCLMSIGGAPCESGESVLVCNSGGSVYCFRGECSGNISGEPIPGIPSQPQCYVNSCCFGSGCD